MIERVFLHSGDVIPGRPLTRPELEMLRRSVAASGQLPSDQLMWLLSETERLLRERERIAVAVDNIKGPWPELRSALNELHAIVHAAEE